MGYGHVQVLDKGISFVTAVPRHNLGDRCVADGDEYVYMYNKNTATAKAGYAVYLSASTGFSFMMQSATTDVDVACGIIKHVDIPYGEYGWVLVKGLVDVYAGLNTGLAQGDKLIMVSTTNTGNISRKTQATYFSNVVGEPTPFGVMLQVAATAAAGKAQIWGTL